MGVTGLLRASAFHRQRRPARTAEELRRRRASLGSAMLHDLQRGQREGREADVLELLAAAVRHSRSVLVHLQFEAHVLPLTLYPHRGLAHLPVPLESFLGWRLGELRVAGFDVPGVPPPDLHEPADGEVCAPLCEYHPLSLLLWELSLRGPRGTLLPEIDGPAVYRIAPGVDLRSLDLRGSIFKATTLLQRRAFGLNEVARWPDFDRERAARLLNALYLQAGLIVTRSRPAGVDAEAVRSFSN